MGWKVAAVGAIAAAVVIAVSYKASITFGGMVVDDPSPATAAPAADTPLQYTMKDIDGKDVNLADYKGKVVLIVNVASKCGFTKQYAGLEKLYTDNKDKGFVILGFPANDFKQEQGSDADIKTFCTETYQVTFPMFSKVNVKGPDQSPLYKYLTSKETGGKFAGPVSWNFNKFLIDKSGRVYGRFGSKTTPQDKELVEAVEKGLKG